MIKVLFSESELYYRSLGLLNEPGLEYTFDGMSSYKNVKCNDFDLFICSFYTLPQSMILTLKFRKQAIRTVIIVDGIFDFANVFKNDMHQQYNLDLYFPLIQDSIIAADKECLHYFPNDIEKFSYRPMRMISSIKNVKMPNKKRVLITTANSAYFDEYEFDLLVDLIISAIDYSRLIEVDCDLRIFDSRLLNEIKSRVVCCPLNKTHDSFEKAIKDYSVIITTPSSISITSMYHNRSVITLSVRTNPVNIQSGWNVSSEKLIQVAILEAVENPVIGIKQQKLLLEKYLNDCNLNNAIKEVTKSDFTKKKLDYIESMNYKMLNSKFNFNFEYLIRKIYNRYAGMPLLKFLRKKVKW